MMAKIYTKTVIMQQKQAFRTSPYGKSSVHEKTVGWVVHGEFLFHFKICNMAELEQLCLFSDNNDHRLEQVLIFIINCWCIVLKQQCISRVPSVFKTMIERTGWFKLGLSVKINLYIQSKRLYMWLSYYFFCQFF